VRWWRPAAIGTEARTAARPRSQAIITGRRWTRSSQAPAGSERKRKGIRCSPASSPTSKAWAWRSRMAAVGSARKVTPLPRKLTVCPSQSLRKSGRAVRTRIRAGSG
jgi:hypothetical protein